jgi:hypothetical protein
VLGLCPSITMIEALVTKQGQQGQGFTLSASLDSLLSQAQEFDKNLVRSPEGHGIPGSRDQPKLAISNNVTRDQALSRPLSGSYPARNCIDYSTKSVSPIQTLVVHHEGASTPPQSMEITPSSTPSVFPWYPWYDRTALYHHAA